jgi:hypothetical protein
MVYLLRVSDYPDVVERLRELEVPFYDYNIDGASVIVDEEFREVLERSILGGSITSLQATRYAEIVVPVVGSIAQPMTAAQGPGTAVGNSGREGVAGDDPTNVMRTERDTAGHEGASGDVDHMGDPALAEVTPTTRIARRTATPRVIVKNCRTTISQFIVPASEVLLPVATSNVHLWYREGRITLPLDRPGFNIHVYASPVDSYHSGLDGTPDTIFGIGRWGGSYLLTMSRYGIPIYDGQVQVAEVIRNGQSINIYIPFALSRYNVESRQIFKAILEHAVVVMNMTQAEADAIRATVESDEASTLVDRYITLCNSVVSVPVSNIENSLADLVARRTLYERDLVELNRTIEVKEAALDNAKRNKTTDLSDKYRRDLEAIQRFPKVRLVGVRKGNIEVYTKCIYCLDDRSDKYHRLGEYRILIPLRQTRHGRDGIRFLNLTEVSPHGYQAPHVFSEGNACFGTLNNVIPDLISGIDIPPLVSMLIQFLETANTADSAGRNVSMWPEATLEEVTREQS